MSNEPASNRNEQLQSVKATTAGPSQWALEDDGFLLLILSSPSGAGKSTLTAKLRERFPRLAFSVSHTTRAPRATEKDGREYHFIDRATFERMVADNAFVEWAHVHDNYYGTSDHEVQRAKGCCDGILFDVDFQGARQIRARYPQATTVFILPPSLDELERRLRTRASDSEQSIRRRLAAALGEIEHYGFFDYLVINDQLEIAAEQLESIVIAEGCKRAKRAQMAEMMLREAHRR